MSPKFQAYKNTTDMEHLDFTSNYTECYNAPFSLADFSESLKNSRQ